MKTIKHFNQISLSLGTIGLLPALFLWWQNWLMQPDYSKFNTEYSFGGTSIYEEMALRYCFISISFLLSIFFILIRKKIFLKVIDLIPLTFIIIQCWLLIIYKKEVFKGEWIYSNWLEITYYIDFCFLGLAITLITLDIYSIWLNYYSKRVCELR